jgi:uncharacterized protein YraI
MKGAVVGIICLVMILSFGVAAAQGTNTVVVTSGAAHVRSGPGANTTSLGVAPQGGEMQVTGRTANSTWWRVDSPYGVGWISDVVVTFRGNRDTVPVVSEPVGTIEPPVAYIAFDSVKVYRNPNADSFILGLAPHGNTFVITGRSYDGNWWQISTPLGTGYVVLDQVALRGDATNTPRVGDPGPSFSGPTIRANTDLPISSQPGGETTIGTLTAGSVLPTGGRTADNTWWQVAGTFGFGWVPVNQVSLAGSASNITITSNATFAGPAYTGAAVGNVVIETDRKVAYALDSFDSDPMWAAHLGDQGTVVARSIDGLWLEVIFGNYTGWMHFSGITLQGSMLTIPVFDTTPPPVENIVLVATGRLNVRSGPGIEYSDLGSLPYLTRMTVTGRHPTLPWLRVESPFGTGWVRIMYIVFRGDWSAVPLVTEPIGTIEMPVHIASLNIQVYSQPDIGYPAGEIPPGEYTIIGRNEARTWAQLQTPSGNVWIPYESLILRGVESLIPVVP